jgi:tripartite-type tricarboxylate transporter receptor subunit TctC
MIVIEPTRVSAFGRMFAVAMSLAFLTPLVATKQAVAQQASAFYNGKEIRLLIGGAAGGGYDTYGRFLATYLPRFIPGHPKIIVENVPGAGGIRMANNLFYNVPKDGLTIGISAGSVLTTSMLEVGAPKFDVKKFTFLGSLNNEVGMIMSWHTSPVKTANDLLSQELVVGGTSASDNNVLFPIALNHLVGTKLRPVPGYSGTPEISLAMERGEVQGIGSWHYSSIITSKPDWVKDKKVNFLVQLSLQKHPDFPNIPNVLDLVKNDEQREIMEVLFSQQTMGRPVYGPPGIPEDRAAILQKAFADMIKDPKALQAADAQNLELISPMTGSEMTTLINHLYSIPPTVVELAREAVKSSR